MLGMSEAMVAKWEAMHRFPGAFFLMCWAKALGVRFIVQKEDQET
jgi:transcriptional regulator with XRE-family HTH domain